MRRDNLIKKISALLAVIMLSVLIASCTVEEGEEGCGFADTSLLEHKAYMMNAAIDEVVCCRGSLLTREQLAICVSNFENIQTKYSKKLICEEEGDSYYYPAFVLEADYDNKNIKDNTRYIIVPLDRDDNGVYTGVKVTAREVELKDPTELELKVQEMNSKLRSFECSGLTLEEMEKRVAEFESFAAGYSNQLICVDEKGDEHYYPKFYCAVRVTDYETGENTYNPETTRYRITHNNHSLNKDGVYTGLVVYLYVIEPGELELGLL